MKNVSFLGKHTRTPRTYYTVVNKRIWVCDSKYVVILYPPPAGHMVARMRIVNLLVNLRTPRRCDLERPKYVVQQHTWGRGVCLDGQSHLIPY